MRTLAHRLGRKTKQLTRRNLGTAVVFAATAYGVNVIVHVSAHALASLRLQARARNAYQQRHSGA